MIARTRVTKLCLGWFLSLWLAFWEPLFFTINNIVIRNTIASTAALVFYKNVFGDEITQSGQAGQLTGANFVLNYEAPSVNNGTPPPTSGSNTLYTQELFPTYTPGNTETSDLSTLQGSPENLPLQGLATGVSLLSGTDETSLAYQTLRDAAGNPAHDTTDMRSELFLEDTKQILDGTHPVFDDLLTGCDTSVASGPDGTTEIIHSELIKVCPQIPVNDPSNCQITRDFTLNPVVTQEIMHISSAESNVNPAIEIFPNFDSINLCHSNVINEYPHFQKYEFYQPTGIVQRINYFPQYYCGDHTGRTEQEIENACVLASIAMNTACLSYDPNVSSQLQCLRWFNGLERFYGGPTGSWSHTSGCPPSFINQGEISTWCTTARQTQYQACMDIGTATQSTMNGNELITVSDFGVIDTQQNDVNLFGTLVDISFTPINPANYGLSAGNYVYANQVVTSDGLVSHTVLDGGSFSSNWNSQHSIDLNNAVDVSIVSTMYEIVSNDFVPEGCTNEQIQSVENGVCPGSIQCADYSSCRNVDGVNVCDVQPTLGVSQTMTPWSDVISSTPIQQMCWRVDVTFGDCNLGIDCIANPSACPHDCSHLSGAERTACEDDSNLCWTNTAGEYNCLTSTSEPGWSNNLGDEGFVDDCNDLVINPDCELLEDISCVEGMFDPVEGCQRRTRYFDCGPDVEVPGIPGAPDTEVTCNAAIRCIGDECVSTATESNPDFIRAATAGQMMTEFAHDVNCDFASNPENCMIFSGERNGCRNAKGNALGIRPECCKMAREMGSSMGDFSTYLQLTASISALADNTVTAQYVAENYSGTAIETANNIIADPIQSGYTSVMNTLGFGTTEVAANASAQAGEIVADNAASAAGGSGAGGMGVITRYVASGFNWALQQMGFNELASSLFEQSGDFLIKGWATEGLGQIIGAIISVVGWILLIYQIATIVASIIYECEDEELAFGMQLNNRACHFVGTYCANKRLSITGIVCVMEMQVYCCFSSPFTRIINEQLRLQGIGGDWGTAMEPNCEGIRIGDLEDVDWDLVDLSEWTAIMMEAGLIPDPNNPPANFVPSDTFLGDSGNAGEGMTSTDINIEAIDLIRDEADASRELNEDEDPDVVDDPELMPWY